MYIMVGPNLLTRAYLLQAWGDRKWTNLGLKALASCTYQFVRLYVSSFAFQAHVQRAQIRAEMEETNGKPRSLFPRGKFREATAVSWTDDI